MADLIGTGRCPVCGSQKARFTLSAKNLTVITCNACNFQGFARSDRSDEALRACITPAKPADPPPADPPAADPPAADPPPEPEKPKRRHSFGVLAGMEF